MKKRPASSWPSALVDAVGERVAAAQDLHRRRSSTGAARRMCASTGITGSPSAPRASRSTGSNSCAAAERRAARPWRGRSSASWSASDGAVPDLDQHPDPARDEVACRRASTPARRRRRPRRARVERLGVLGVDVVRAVLEAHQVARRRPARGSCVDVRPKPSCDQRITTRAAADPGEVADRVEGDLRVVGAGLDAEVAAASARVELVAGQRAAAARSAGGPLRRRARSGLAVRSNSVGPEAERDVSRAGGRPSASPVSSGGAAGSSLPSARRARPAVIRARRRRPRAQQRRAAPRGASLVRSNAAKCSRSCAGVAIPAWCAPWNGDRRRRGVGASASPRERDDAAARRSADPAAPRRRREQAPAA